MIKYIAIFLSVYSGEDALSYNLVSYDSMQECYEAIQVAGAPERGTGIEWYWGNCIRVEFYPTGEPVALVEF